MKFLLTRPAFFLLVAATVAAGASLSALAQTTQAPVATGTPAKSAVAEDKDKIAADKAAIEKNKSNLKADKAKLREDEKKERQDAAKERQQKR